MPPRLLYPDLTPPSSWRKRGQGSQIWLTPPDEAAAPAGIQTAIIVSPLLANDGRLPPPGTLIAMAIRAEELGTLHIDEREGPTATGTDSGLPGVYFFVRGHVRPSGPPEQRLYVLYSDDTCYYGINYVAAVEHFAQHRAMFWQVARSIKGLKKRPQASSAASPPAAADRTTAVPGGPAAPGIAKAASETVASSDPWKVYED